MPFWLPPTLLMGLFVYGGIAWNVLFSFTNFSGLTYPEYTLSEMGLYNYTRALQDPSFLIATRNTVVLLIVFTAVCLAVGLLVAILLDRQIRFKNTFRTIYLLPFALSFVVTALFWAWMFNPVSGVINLTLRSIGLDFLAMNWLGDPRLRLGSVMFALVWQYSGYAMVVFLASLQAIPKEHYEAARIDGATTYRVYRRVIVPQLGPAAVAAAVVLMVFALKAFDFLYVLFGFNPGPSADILATMMYREAFQAQRWAYGAAIGTILFVVSLIILAPYLYKQYRRGEL